MPLRVSKTVTRPSPNAPVIVRMQALEAKLELIATGLAELTAIMIEMKNQLGLKSNDH